MSKNPPLCLGFWWNSYVGCVTHRGGVEADADDVGPVVERLILSDDKCLTFILHHLMNRSII